MNTPSKAILFSLIVGFGTTATAGLVDRINDARKYPIRTEAEIRVEQAHQEMMKEHQEMMQRIQAMHSQGGDTANLTQEQCMKMMQSSMEQSSME